MTKNGKEEFYVMGEGDDTIFVDNLTSYDEAVAEAQSELPEDDDTVEQTIYRVTKVATVRSRIVTDIEKHS